jgi:hypothetical protein
MATVKWYYRSVVHGLFPSCYHTPRETSAQVAMMRRPTAQRHTKELCKISSWVPRADLRILKDIMQKCGDAFT